jgi:GNAT superfamily N-acetyltransferase
MRLRVADENDFGAVAQLHADSWRRHYRGAYAEAYLDGDLIADRRAVWSARLGSPAGTETVLAEDGDRLVGFVHVVLDADAEWGSLVDNLHVVHDRKRGGIGARLLSSAAAVVERRAAGMRMYLWVLEQNAAAQAFYLACGAANVETSTAAAPNGDPANLVGLPGKYRMAWNDVRRMRA